MSSGFLTSQDLTVQLLHSEVLQWSPQTWHKEYLLPYLRSCILNVDVSDTDVPLTRYLRSCPLHKDVTDADVPLTHRLLLVESLTLDRAHFPSLKSPSFWRRMPLLTKLDFSHCSIPASPSLLLPSVVAAIHPNLRRLNISGSRDVTQAMIDPFTSLEELNITRCTNITNVHFCSRTLRKLYANDSGLTDEGLARAVHLEVLHVYGVRGVTTVAPFAVSLLELDGGSSCGIDDAGLATATNIRVLRMSANDNITTVEPFAASLRELNAAEYCGIGDRALAMTTGIVKLDVGLNPSVTTVAPFAASLRELTASFGCGVADSGLSMATRIVKLVANNNRNITTVAPFTVSLRHLSATGSCSIDNQGLSTATGLVELYVVGNKNISSLAPFEKSLCALVALDSGIDQQIQDFYSNRILLY